MTRRIILRHHRPSLDDLRNASSVFLIQVVAVISAMKMEMAVQSQVSGVVRATHVAVGDKIDPEDLLVEVEEEQQ